MSSMATLLFEASVNLFLLKSPQKREKAIHFQAFFYVTVGAMCGGEEALSLFWFHIAPLIRRPNSRHKNKKLHAAVH